VEGRRKVPTDFESGVYGGGGQQKKGREQSLKHAKTYVKSIETTERLSAALADICGSLGRVQSLVTLAIVLTREAFVASWPFAHVWPFFSMRAEMAPQVEPAREGASTTWNRANEVGLVSAAASARSLGCARRDLLFLDLKDGRQARRGGRWRRIVNIGGFKRRHKARVGAWHTGVGAGGTVDGGSGSSSCRYDVGMIVEHRGVGCVVDVRMRSGGAVVGQSMLGGVGGRRIPWINDSP